MRAEEARKRRRRKIARAIWRAYRRTILFAIALIIAVVAVITGVFACGKQEEPQQAAQAEQAEEVKAEDIVIDPAEGGDAEMMDPDNFVYPYNLMSCDWGAGDTDGLTLYEIPEEYQRTGGKLPQVVQVYTYCLCREYEIDYNVIIAMIEVESGYRWDAESGMAYGYMQIVPEFHRERMEQLHVTDIMKPYGNIRVGIDYFAELVWKYEWSYTKALTAYKYGEYGADQEYFSKGKATSGYAETVMEIADRIRDREA